MTTGGPLGERLVTAPQLLDLCDQALGEISRRRHLFSWLRGPGADEWLAVDAYYPANRLVVMCRERPAASDELIAERVPEHGLRLLALAPDELAADPAGVDAALRRRLEPLRRREPAPQPRLPPPDPSHRQPTRAPRPQAIRRERTRGVAPPARHHPLAAALLIAALVTVVVIAVAIVTAAHG
jgi:hypothetical protein